MTTDIDNLIAEALEWVEKSRTNGYRSGDLVARLAAALASRQTTTREKLAAIRIPHPNVPSLQQRLSTELIEAIFATDIFVDADKIAADAWDEAHAAVNAYYSIAGGGPTNPYGAPVTAPTETEKP